MVRRSRDVNIIVDELGEVSGDEDPDPSGEVSGDVASSGDGLGEGSSHGLDHWGYVTDLSMGEKVSKICDYLISSRCYLSYHIAVPSLSLPRRL